MRIKDLRIGDYVDVIVLNGIERTLCIVVDINIDECIPTMRNLTNNFEFNVGTKEKWNLVKDISEIGTQLERFCFVHKINEQVYMLLNNKMDSS